MMKNIFSLPAAAFFLALAFLGVGMVGPQTFFPYTGVKLFWFRTAVSLAVISLAGWMLSASQGEIKERMRRFGSSPLVGAVTIFAGLFLCAAVFSYDPRMAFWSNFERGEGGFQMIYYYLFFLLLVAVMDSEERWQKFRMGIMAGTFLVAGYGILAALDSEAGGRFFFGPVGVSGLLGERFSGSLGNAGFAGSFFLLSLWWACLAYAEGRNEVTRVRWLGVIATITVFLFLTQTRGAVLGFFAGIVVFCGHLLWTRRRFHGLLGVVIAAVALLGGVYLGRPVIKDVPIVGRVSRFSLEDRSIKTRFLLWQTALRGSRERPILGWGPENFSIVFDRYFDTRHVLPGEISDTWYDRAHNVFLDYAAGIGIAGLLGYVGIFAAYYVQFFRNIRRGLFSNSSVEQALFFIFPVVYLLPLLLLFDLFPTYIHLFSFLAFAEYTFRNTAVS